MYIQHQYPRKIIHKNIEKIQNEIRGYEFSIKGDSDYIEKLNGEVEYLLKVRSKSSGDQSKLNSLYEEKEKISGELTKSMENRRYYEVAFSLFKDTGIKTNIIKQYLPVMNHLINKNLSMMNCYFNFMLDENFNETI